MSRVNGSEMVAIGNNEYIKEFFVYDITDRLIEVYQARNNALHGEPALKTEYTYIGVTSRIEKSKESNGTWDSSWDI